MAFNRLNKFGCVALRISLREWDGSTEDTATNVYTNRLFSIMLSDCNCRSIGGRAAIIQPDTIIVAANEYAAGNIERASTNFDSSRAAD